MSQEERTTKKKLELLKLSSHLDNVSRACKIYGYSRDSFYRFKKLYEEGGESALHGISRKKPNIKNRVPEDVEDAVIRLSVENPAFGKERAANELKKQGIFISPGGVRNVWLRNNIETIKKRLAVLQENRAKDGLMLSEAFENREESKEIYGELQTDYPDFSETKNN